MVARLVHVKGLGCGSKTSVVHTHSICISPHSHEGVKG